MNRQFIISVVVLFVWTMIAGMVVHGLLLGPDYTALTSLYRPEEDARNYLVWMLVGHLSMAIGITWIYRVGREDKPWLQQGIRFGIALIFLMNVSIYLFYYAAQPMPADLVQKQIAFDAVALVLTGIVTAFVNK